MNGMASGAAASRLLRQLSLSPASVAKAAVWRGLRRPWLRWRHQRTDAGASSTAYPRLRPRLQWACALLDAAVPPSPADAALIMRSPAVLFGRCWSLPAAQLAALDPRFGVEAFRLQHLQALAALHWHARVKPALAAELAGVLHEPLERFLDRALRQAASPDSCSEWQAAPHATTAAAITPYPMDHALRALSLLIVRTALQGPADADPPGTDAAHATSPGGEAEAAVAAATSRAIEACLSDPEYVGRLSNNHHLTNVACLLAMLASLATRDPRFERVVQWLLRALDDQFATDGAHFELSTGYHMCALELLALAALALAEDGASPFAMPAAARWRMLGNHCPPLAATLLRAFDFAQALIRPDGTFPLIGDFDASRILRTSASYDALPAAATPSCRRVERLRLPTSASSRVPVEAADRVPAGAASASVAGAASTAWVEATVIESCTGDAPVRMVRALFDPPAATSPATPVRPVRRSSGHPGAGVSRVQASVALDDDDLHLVGQLLGPLRKQLRSGVRYRFAAGSGLRWDRIRIFEGAGLALGRGESILVTLRSGVPGQRRLGTHSHLDHLASDIWIAGGDCIPDPGSWCYGASPILRNRYRSNLAHFTPLWRLDWSASLHHPFFIDRPPPGATLAADGDALWGRMPLGSGWVSRIVTLRDGDLVVLDTSSQLDLSPWPWRNRLPLADGYFGPLRRNPPAVDRQR